MPKDMLRQGMVFALGVLKISSDNFSEAVKRLERRNKVSSAESKKMVHNWIGQQMKQLEKMKKELKREVLRSGIYSSRDLLEIKRVITRLSKEIMTLQKKKKKAEKAVKKAGRKKKSAKKKKRPAKKKTKKRPARKKAKKRKAKPAKKKKRKR